MVRNIAGLLVEIGEGERPPDWLDEVLAGRDRRLGGGTAPAHGLTLWRVGYDDELPDPDPDDED
jgi:tRNA pseudouridine38-40 synthase